MQVPLDPDELLELRALVDVGLAELDRGEFVEFTADEIIAEGKAELDCKEGK